MLKLTIQNTHIESRGGVKDGREWSRHSQEGMLHLPSGEVRRVEMDVQPGEPMAAGDYQPKDSAIFMDKWNEPKFSLRARNWQLVKAAAAVKAA